MPILDVEIVLIPGEALPETLASLLAQAAAQALGAPRGRTWVKIKTIEASNYAEDTASPRAAVSPVFVHILKSTPPRDEGKNIEIRRLTEAVARLCDRPLENVHIIYLPPASGRIAFGGKLVQDPEQPR